MKKATVASVVVALLFSMTTAFGASAFAAQGDFAASALPNDGTQAHATATTKELNKVKKKFPSAKTVINATGKNLDTKLYEAEDKASAKKPVIVHVTGKVSNASYTIPANVILVGESTTTYSNATFRLDGSIFGGKYTADYGPAAVTAAGLKAKGVNGYIEDLNITGGGKYGIQVISGSTGVKINNCKVAEVGDCGIEVIGATVALIQNCTVTGVGESGIDLIHADVKTIKNCTVKNVHSHGISTDTEHSNLVPNKKTCVIGTIQNCTVTGVGHHGIYVEAKSTIKKIQNCKLFNNKMTGINVGKYGTIKSLRSNKIYGNTKTNITASGKNASVTLGMGNKIYKSKNFGISISAGGKMYITGANNQIYNNASNGITVVNSGSFLKATGKNTQVKNNKNNGISFNDKAKGTVTKVKFSNNKAHNLYVASGCKVTSKNNTMK